MQIIISISDVRDFEGLLALALLARGYGDLLWREEIKVQETSTRY
jgi:hypothetical protein